MLRQKHCFNKWILYSVHKHFNFTPFIQDTMQYMWLEGSLLALRTFFSHVFIHFHLIFLFFRCLKLILYNLLKNWQFKSWFSNHSIYIFFVISERWQKNLSFALFAFIMTIQIKKKRQQHRKKSNLSGALLLWAYYVQLQVSMCIT